MRDKQFEVNVKKESQKSPVPFAKFSGALSLGGKHIDVYVLSNEERVLSMRGIVRAFTGANNAVVEEIPGVKAVFPLAHNDFCVEDFPHFLIPGNPRPARGITAEQFIDFCRAYIEAMESGALKSDKHRRIAMQCAAFLYSSAKVGLIALIDETTGYQAHRENDALQVKIKAFVADELRAWEKTFPDALWEEFGRLTRWRGPLHSRPKYWGKIVMETIYNTLDPDVAEYLKNNKPSPYKTGQNYHQWLTRDFGLRTLVPHIHQILGIAKTCADMGEFRRKVAHYYRHVPIQMMIYVPARIM